MEPARQTLHQSPLHTALHRHEAASALALQGVTAAIGKLRFGTIQLTVHDGRVVQLDVTERQRFT